MNLSISLALAVPSMPVVFAYAFMFAEAFDQPFATTTNVAFIFTALHILLDENFTTSATIVPFPICPVLVLTGMSSFKYHAEDRIIGSSGHSFDMLFGWLLAIHITYASVCVCSYIVLKSRRAVLCICAAFLVASCATVVCYEDYLKLDYVVYTVCVSITSICYVPIRLVTLDVSSRSAVWVALSETAVIVTALTAALYSHASLVGTKLGSRHDSEYDFYHGNWHFLVSVSVSAIYARIIQAASSMSSGGTQCACQVIPIDLIGTSALFVYSVVCILLKETNADIDAARSILCVVYTPMFAHACASIATSLGWHLKTTS